MADQADSFAVSVRMPSRAVDIDAAHRAKQALRTRLSTRHSAAGAWCPETQALLQASLASNSTCWELQSGTDITKYFIRTAAAPVRQQKRPTQRRRFGGLGFGPSLFIGYGQAPGLLRFIPAFQGCCSERAVGVQLGMGPELRTGWPGLGGWAHTARLHDCPQRVGRLLIPQQKPPIPLFRLQPSCRNRGANRPGPPPRQNI